MAPRMNGEAAMLNPVTESRYLDLIEQIWSGVGRRDRITAPDRLGSFKAAHSSLRLGLHAQPGSGFGATSGNIYGGNISGLYPPACKR